ncbi:unnamed protein product [Haemonchus placei]|uniref:Uncharacterized protein n=1 Tax=Haemonchus placei TaxID=6290 RepID=A0A0N4WD47_HAEPC|nr:unnamed protein product [Haemonchus placei]
MDEAAEAGEKHSQSLTEFRQSQDRYDFPSRPDGTVTASRRAMEKVIHDICLDFFDGHVYYLLTILGKMKIPLLRFSPPEFDMPSRR